MARNTGNKGNGEGDSPPADDTGGKGVKPRDYVVCRETTVAELRNPEALNAPDDARVLVVLGPASAKTPKAARIEVAKAKLDEDALKAGVDLNAVAAKALDSGRKTVKLETRPLWDA